MIIDLNMIGLLLTDLNQELSYKASENYPAQDGKPVLKLHSDGERHQIFMFDGLLIWDSELDKAFSDLKIEEEIEQNTRENFEKHIRLLINDKLAMFESLNA